MPDLPVNHIQARARSVEKRPQAADAVGFLIAEAFRLQHEQALGSGAHPPRDRAPTSLQIESASSGSACATPIGPGHQAYIEKYPAAISSLAKNRLRMLRPTRVATTEPVAPKPVVEPAPAPAPATRAAAPTAAPAKPEERPAEKPVVIAAAPASAPTSAPPAAPVPAPAIAPAPAAAKAADQLPGREIAPGVRELTFPDGSIYRGAVRGSSLHGKGEYVSKAFKYEGDFDNGLKQGQGTYVWDNGDRYDGKFANDRPDGIGKYHFANGSEKDR
jgi:hypothetical protein